MDAAARHGRHWCIGLHPWWVDEASDSEIADALAELSARLERGGPIAVGECGLDHVRCRDAHARQRQARVLSAQFDLARAHALPVVLHVVRATGAALQGARDARLARGGLVHGFVGSLETAWQWYRLGFLLGIGPAIHRSRRLRDALVALPSSSFVVESDDADPASELPAVRDAIARLRGEDPDHTARYTEENARRLFGLPGRSA